MKLLAVNGSPRAASSNTEILLNAFSSGFLENSQHEISRGYITRPDELLELYGNADHVIIAFPLYTDAMPAQVLEFLEVISQQRGHKTLGWIIQSGFPESCHSLPVTRYLESLAAQLGHDCSGTVIKGGVEGIQVKPRWMVRPLLKAFFQLGRSYSLDGRFCEEMVKRLHRPEKLHPLAAAWFRALIALGIPDTYWRVMLKKHGAHTGRFDAPYL